MDEALRGLVNRDYVGSRQHLDQQLRAVRKGAHPTIIDFTRLFVERAGKAGIPLFAHNMVRTAEQQNALLNEGVSKAGAGKSPHNFGCAVDIVHAQLAWNMSKDQWDLLYHIGSELAKSRGFKLVWGGNWNFYDPAHWELADWRSQKGQFPWPTK